MSANDIADKVARAMLAAEGTGATWGIEILEAGEGRSKLRMTVRAHMLNGHGTGHGGIVFSLADTAFAYACNSRNLRSVGAQASIVYLAPAGEGDVLIAEAEERSLVGRSGVYAVSVVTEDGRAIAEFTGFSRSVGGAVIADEQ